MLNAEHGCEVFLFEGVSPMENIVFFQGGNLSAKGIALLKLKSNY